MEEPENPRYTVESGTDGSWLLIDRGSDRDRRHACERFTHEQQARLNASELSSLDSLTANLPGSGDPHWPATDAAVDQYTAEFDKAYNFNHLLRVADDG